MHGPVTVICAGHKMDITSGKDLPQDIKWTFVENWKHIEQKSGRGYGNYEVSSIILSCLTIILYHDMFLNLMIC